LARGGFILGREPLNLRSRCFVHYLAGQFAVTASFLSQVGIQAIFPFEGPNCVRDG
jgi:hypothetical protein